MPELRVTVHKDFDKILERLVEKGLHPSKAELMRSAAVYFLMRLGLLEWVKE